LAHEDLNRTQTIEGSSDRAFGLVFAAVFLVLSLWPLFRGVSPRWWALGLSAGFALVALARPALLATPNRLWTKLGFLLGKVISPIALGILFYGVLTPFGTVIRLMGKDPLRLKREPAVRTYWIPREPPGPPPNSMTNQF
jgi:hypothetical protein